MTAEQKIEVFSTLYDNFETDEILPWFKEMITGIPDYIFEIPASTTRKYHNAQQCEMKGQIIHELMFAQVLEDFLTKPYYREKAVPDPVMRDCMRTVPVLHDSLKCDTNGSKYTVFEHPMLAGDWVERSHCKNDIDQKYKTFIADMCRAHSGQWSTSNRSKVVLPEPKNDQEFLIHMCDIISSRAYYLWVIPEAVIKTTGYKPTSGTQVSGPVQNNDADMSDPLKAVLTFGKHKGEKLIDMSKTNDGRGYISWMKDQDFSDRPIGKALEHFNANGVYVG